MQEFDIYPVLTENEADETEGERATRAPNLTFTEFKGLFVDSVRWKKVPDFYHTPARLSLRLHSQKNLEYDNIYLFRYRVRGQGLLFFFAV